MQSHNIEAFLALVRAGLWEEDARLSFFEQLDFDEIYRLAEEQTVIGLVAAGLEHISEDKAPQDIALQFVGSAMQLEQRNKAMNQFVGDLIEQLNKKGIETLLIKGQGVAQCYERPLWRAAGDVDLLLDNANYQKAKIFFNSIVPSMSQEVEYSKHISMSIGPWEVELHGNMRANVTSWMDRVIDSVQKDTFENRKTRVWRNGETNVLLPAPDNDVFFVFTHILHHFYRGGGIGIRQICDWSRMLYTYGDMIDMSVLRRRLEDSAILHEWRTFGFFAVKYLGMPENSMPFYENPCRSEQKKAQRILEFILESGNFGHNHDFSYYEKYPFLVRKAISLYRKSGYIVHHFQLFPANSFRFFMRFLFDGILAAARRKG